MLINENLISIRVYGHEAGRPGGLLIRLLEQFHALRLQLALQFADIGEGGQILRVAVPAGIKGEKLSQNSFEPYSKRSK